MIGKSLATAGGKTDWPSVDGRSGGPTVAAGPQYPDAFDDYECIVRPPWHVAGIDYAVGIDDTYSGTLKDPTSGANWPGAAFPSGVTYNGTSKSLRIDGAAAAGTTLVIEGFDFSLNNGVYINGNGANVPNSVTIRNCKFGIGTNNAMGIAITNCSQTTVVIEKCLIDGGGYNDGGLSWVDWENSQTVVNGNYYRTPYEGRIYQATNTGTSVSGVNVEGGLTEPRVDTSTTSGTATYDFIRKAQKSAVVQLSSCAVTLRWNHFKDIPYDGITWSGGSAFTSEFNLFADGNWMCAGHTDYHQLGGGATNDAAIMFRYCTLIQGPVRTARGHPASINSFARIGDFGPDIKVTNPQCYCITVVLDPTADHNGTANTLVNSALINVTQFRGDSGITNPVNKDSTVYSPWYGFIYINQDGMGTNFPIVSADSGTGFTVSPSSKGWVDMKTGLALTYPGLAP